MKNCIFCNSKTSFIFEGEGRYKNKPVCPKCQAEKFKTNYNSGCANDDDCSIRIKRNSEIE